MKFIQDISDFIIERIGDSDTYETSIKISYYKLTGEKVDRVYVVYKLDDNTKDVLNDEGFKSFLTHMGHVLGVNVNATKKI